MKILICLFMLLLAASHLRAETYAWVDEAGTMNFSDNYYAVPKKYRKTLGKRADFGSVETTTLKVSAEKNRSQQSGANVIEAQLSAVETLYAGKSEAVWKSEFSAQETELKRLESRLEQLKSVYRSELMSPGRMSEIRRDYETTAADYNEKYKNYTVLVEAARKAGLKVDIKK